MAASIVCSGYITEMNKVKQHTVCEEKKQGSSHAQLIWEEVCIETNLGCLRGKKVGVGERKILGVHGWLDNANTFDKLVPLLSRDGTFLSIDLPGHGKSDHFPPGFVYDPRGYVSAIKKAVTQLEWHHFTYLGHSMGAVVGIIYASLYPEDVDAFISFDIIKTWSYNPKKVPSKLRNYMDQYFDNETKTSMTPLVYGKEDLIKKTIIGSGSLDHDSACVLLERGSKKSEDGSGYILTRDLRVKTFFIGFFSLDVWSEMAESIKCPIFMLRALDGHVYDTPENLKRMLDSFAEGSSNFTYCELHGKHHVHLTHPEDVARHLNPFLEQTRNASLPNELQNGVLESS